MPSGYSRREILKLTPAGVVLTMAALSAPRVAFGQAKVTKATVQYQDAPKGGHQCASCSNFMAPSSCKVVSGTISPRGWCSIWTPK